MNPIINQTVTSFTGNISKENVTNKHSSTSSITTIKRKKVHLKKTNPELNQTVKKIKNTQSIQGKSNEKLKPRKKRIKKSDSIPSRLDNFKALIQVALQESTNPTLNLEESFPLSLDPHHQIRLQQLQQNENPVLINHTSETSHSSDTIPSFLKLVHNRTKNLTYSFLTEDLETAYSNMNVETLKNHGDKAYFGNQLPLAKWIYEKTFAQMLEKEIFKDSIKCLIKYFEVLYLMYKFDLANSYIDRLVDMCFQEMNANYENNKSKYYKYGFTYARLMIIQKEYAKAKIALLCCKGNTKNFPIDIWLAFILIKSHAYRTAESILRPLVSSTPNTFTLSLYGETQKWLGNTEKANEYFLKAYKAKADEDQLIYPYYPFSFKEFVVLNKDKLSSEKT